jgi:hypothetical protein
MSASMEGPAGTKGLMFAFTVEAVEKTWDAYYFDKDGKPGTMAFTKLPDGRFCIGLFAAGKLDQETVIAKLIAGAEEK